MAENISRAIWAPRGIPPLQKRLFPQDNAPHRGRSTTHTSSLQVCLSTLWPYQKVTPDCLRWVHFNLDVRIVKGIWNVKKELCSFYLFLATRPPSSYRNTCQEKNHKMNTHSVYNSGFYCRTYMPPSLPVNDHQNKGRTISHSDPWILVTGPTITSIEEKTFERKWILVEKGKKTFHAQWAKRDLTVNCIFHTVPFTAQKATKFRNCYYLKTVRKSKREDFSLPCQLLSHDYEFYKQTENKS